MPGWALDLYYKFDASADTVARLADMSKQTKCLAVTKGTDGKGTLDTDWASTNLSDALS